MEIDLQIVRRVFEDVLASRISREQADRWAYSVVQQNEAGTLKYSPPKDRERIWAAVMYLYGVDMTTAPGEYLHTDNDIRIEMNEKFAQQ